MVPTCNAAGWPPPDGGVLPSFSTFEGPTGGGAPSRSPGGVTASIPDGPSPARTKGRPDRGGSAGRLGGEPGSHVRPRSRGRREATASCLAAGYRDYDPRRSQTRWAHGVGCPPARAPNALRTVRRLLPVIPRRSGAWPTLRTGNLPGLPSASPCILAPWSEGPSDCELHATLVASAAVDDQWCSNRLWVGSLRFARWPHE
jgi:hypothetical protein